MSYNTKSCNALQKPYYSPVEAAIRWCGLIAHESMILASCANNPTVVPVSAFPQWPCLRANAEKILDALINGEVPKGRDGRSVPSDEHVAPARLTVRHTDLRAWMATHYPDQKPDFLFDETERNTHSAINADAFRALQADRDALKARIEKAEEWAKSIIAERNALLGERDSLRAMVDKVNTTTETTYLNIIGGLLSLMLGKSPKGEKLSVYESQSAIISAMLAYHEGKPGIAARTMEDKFAAANRSIKST